MQNNSRLDTYLAEIEKRLRPLSPQQREEEMREVRAHLEQLTAR